jgi:hypothetical protein
LLFELPVNAAACAAGAGVNTPVELIHVPLA